MCWTGYNSAAVIDGPRCLMLYYPDPTCGVAIGQDMMNLLASDENKEKYSHYFLRSYIKDNKKAKWCPTPGCDYAADSIDW